MTMTSSDEYLIYGYAKYHVYNFGRNQWQFLSKSKDQEMTIQQAQQFYSSQNYDRVEVKKKYFDNVQQKFKLKTVEIIGLKKVIPTYPILLGFLFGVIVFGGLMLGDIIHL